MRRKKKQTNYIHILSGFCHPSVNGKSIKSIGTPNSASTTFLTPRSPENGDRVTLFYWLFESLLSKCKGRESRLSPVSAWRPSSTSGRGFHLTKCWGSPSVRCFKVKWNAGEDWAGGGSFGGCASVLGLGLPMLPGGFWSVPLCPMTCSSWPVGQSWIWVDARLLSSRIVLLPLIPELASVICFPRLLD